MNSLLKTTINTCAVIPFFNEKKTIDVVVKNVLKYIDVVIAVDDGSTDGSADNLNASDNLIVLNHTENKGKGAALNTGFKKAAEIGSRLTFTIDADLQHDEKAIPKFIECANKFDIVIGNRLGNLTSMPYHRRLSNLITSKMLSWKTGASIKDSQSGYRLYKTDILENIIPVRTGFEAESEILVNAARKNYKIGFVNISTIYNDNESKMRSLEAIKGFISVITMK